MKAIFKKTAVIAVSVSLILLLALSVMPMAFAADEAAQNNTWATEAGDVELGERLSAMNISLSGQITMKFYFEDLTDAHSYIKVTVPQQKGEAKELTFSKASLNKDGERYVVSVPVAAAQQTDLVTLQWFNAAGEGAKIRQYSVKYYADKVIELAKTDDKYVDMSQTAKSMLNYGAMAQTIFGYKTENLANAGLYTEANNPINNMVVADLYGAKANVIEDKDVFKGVQMFLQDDVSMRIYVNGDSATVNGKAVSVKEDENGSYVSIYNIPATKFADVFTVAVTAGDKTATAEISVLGWCLDTLASYRLDPAKEAGLKNVAKSLYMYYTWTKGYADDAHIPGTAECIHDRTHTEGNTVICSDCGFAFANSMRLGLTADTVKLEAGVPTDVTFTLSVACADELQSLSTTLKGEGLTITFKSIEMFGNGDGNIGGDAALNIVLDAANAISGEAVLAKVTYTVTAAAGGTYTVTPIVNEAYNADGENISVSIVESYLVFEVAGSIATCQHTKDYKVEGDKHQASCDICRAIGEWEPHTAAGTASATNVPTVFETVCACGAKSTTTDVNEEGLKMFNAAELAERAAGQGGANYSVTEMTEGTLDFVRFQTLVDINGEAYFWPVEAVDADITGVSDYLMIVYRASQGFYPSIDVFISNTDALDGTMYSARNIHSIGEWQVAVFDFSEATGYDDTLNVVSSMRIDIINGSGAKGEYIDIAYMGFFKNDTHAIENYGKAVALYGFDRANFFLTMDKFVLDGTEYTAGNGPVAAGNGIEGLVISADLTNFAPKTVSNSITFSGWIVTPSGAKSISYRIIDANGNASEIKEFVKPGKAYDGILAATTEQLYGDTRANGSVFQGDNKKFDLFGYEGQTVSVEVILTNNWGQTATILTVKNIAVSSCAHANKIAKTFTAPTTTEDGWLAHTACPDCGKAWNAEGEEIAVPTIDKLVPTVNKYVGYETLKTWVIAGNPGNYATQPNADKTYVRYISTANAGDGNANFLTGGTSVTGQYLVIKYRTNHTDSMQVWANTLANGHDGGKANTYVSMVVDEQWHIKVIDLAAVLPTYVKPADDGTYTIQWGRIDLLDKGSAAGAYFDIGFLALTDDLSKIASVLLEGDEKVCDHNMTTATVWSSENKMYSCTCYVCGDTVTSDMLYKTEAHKETPNCGTYTQMDGFIRYTWTTEGNKDAYVHVYRNGTVAAGKYMVITYRLVNNGINPTNRTWFAGTTAGGNTGATGGGDNSGIFKSGLVADGQWHTLTVTVSDANTKFIANADGTYTWAYLRIGYNPAAFDGSCYFDVAEIAFADNQEAAELYAHKNDSIPPFLYNFDNTNNEIDGATFLGGNKQNEGCLTFDMTGKVLSTPTSLVLGGWNCTPGGVDYYYYRVTKIDGVAVENPELVKWQDGANRADLISPIVNPRGYSEASANGAGFSKKVVDLTAWAGHTIDLELVAVTNYGSTVVFGNFQNITVPAAQ